MATDVTIAIAARNAGFPQEQIKTAVMVALGESGGNEFATNHNDNGTTDYGLWQINSVHTDALKLGNWQSPSDNAKMAYLVYQKQGWNAWVAYKNNSYAKFESRGAQAANVLGVIGGIPGAITSAANADDSQPLAQFFTFVSDRHNWQRVGMVLAGAYLVMLVFVSIAKNTGLVEAGAKTVGVVTRLL